MHENKNDAPTSKVFYRPLEASIRWAGLLRYEQVILASVSSPMNLPQSLDCPRLGELRLYTASSTGNCPSGSTASRRATPR